MGRSLTQSDPRGYRTLSWWHESADTDWAPRPPLPGDRDADVAIVGAGFTGLWTAYYLARADPSLRIVVLEAEVAGFGASGRNGGWCSALFPKSLHGMASYADRSGALAQHAAMRDTVDEVGRVLAAEGIDAHYAKGGTVVVARTPAQLTRARAEVDDARAWGRGEDDLRLLGAGEARSLLGATDVLGATYTPRLRSGAPRSAGAPAWPGSSRATECVLHEGTRALAIEPGQVRTDRGTVRADVVVRATEGYTRSLEGRRRDAGAGLLPHRGHRAAACRRLGRDRAAPPGDLLRPAARDHLRPAHRRRPARLRRSRSAVPLRFARSGRATTATNGSSPRCAVPWSSCSRCCPRRGSATPGAAPSGIPRDWCASVGLDRSTGLAWAGGYVGDGVATTNLAGRTLRDLVLGQDTELTRLPWVGHRSRRWEPEPLRWLGVNAGLRAMRFADREERLTRRPSVVARAMSPLMGGH